MVGLLSLCPGNFHSQQIGEIVLMSSWRHSPGSAPCEPRLLAIDQLIQRARHGDSEALSSLYHHFLPGVFGYIAARVPDRLTAEDLTSEVFLDMVEGISQVKASEEAKFAAWLFQIARMMVAGYYRKREKVPVCVSFESPSWEDEGQSHTHAANHPACDPVRWSEARADWQVVALAINLLTEEQRQVLVARLILGYDVATVARMLGKKANAIKALQFRALQRLQGLLQKSALSEQERYNHAQQWEERR